MLEVLQALADPRRLEILTLLRDRELTAGEIAQRFVGTRQATSHHLRILHEAQVLTVRTEGTRRYYRANGEALRELRDFLDSFWREKLVSLKHAVESGRSLDDRRHQSEEA